MIMTCVVLTCPNPGKIHYIKHMTTAQVRAQGNTQMRTNAHSEQTVMVGNGDPLMLMMYLYLN